MKSLTIANAIQVNGGNIFAAVTTGAGVYLIAGGIVDNTHTLNDLGQKIGETTFNYVNPDPLGPMVFKGDDSTKK